MKYFIKICCFIFLVSSVVHSNEKITNVSKVFNVGEMKVRILVDAKHGKDASILVGDRTVMLLEYKNEEILFDTEIGIDYGVNLIKAPEEIKVKPSDITYIFITHMQIDYIGALVSKAKSVFKNEIIYVPKEEADYRNADAAALKKEYSDSPAKDVILIEYTSLKRFRNAPGIFSDFENDKQNIVYFNYVENITLGNASDKLRVQSEKAFGHTIYKIKNVGKEFMMRRDLLHVTDIQMIYPDISAIYGVDKTETAAECKRVLEYAANHNVITIGTHSEKQTRL